MPVIPKIIASLVRFERLGDRYGILQLKPDSDRWTHNPGQYTEILFGEGESAFAKIYSIASAMRPDGVLDFCIQLNDQQLLESARTWIEGRTEFALAPAAGAFAIPNYAAPVIMLAGGSGITPLKAILEDRMHKGSGQAPIVLLYGCGDDVEIPFHDALVALAAQHKHLTVRFFAETRSANGRAEVGRPLSVLPSYIMPKAEYLMCGPPPFMQAARALLSGAGIRPEQIHQDRY